MIASVFIDNHLPGGADAVGSPGQGPGLASTRPGNTSLRPHVIGRPPEMLPVSVTSTSVSPSIASPLGWQEAWPLQPMCPSASRNLGLLSSSALDPWTAALAEGRFWEARAGRVRSALLSSSWEHCRQGCRRSRAAGSSCPCGWGTGPGGGLGSRKPSRLLHVALPT